MPGSPLCEPIDTKFGSEGYPDDMITCMDFHDVHFTGFDL